MKNVSFFIGAVILSSFVSSVVTLGATKVESPVSPQESLGLFQIAPGLRIELVCAEPLIVDPVESAFDEDGKLWVVEMIDYPDGPAEGEAPLSRIRVLRDHDGDGFYEASQVFVDRILFPTGCL